jgi:phospholipid transport system substrate-binding protein
MMSFNTHSKKIVLTALLLFCALTVKADEWKEASQVVEQSTQAMIDLLMAKFYRRASAQQIKDFSLAFKRSLMNTYSRAVVALKINNFEIQSNANNNSKPGRQKVWVKVFANGAAYDINYAMKKRQQGWKVTNVSLNGINLGLAFRQQFSNAMAQNKGNMDDVIAFWNDPS